MRKEIVEKITQFIEDSFLRSFLYNENITDISYNGTEMWIKDNMIGSYKPEFQPTYDEVYRLGKKIADIQGKEFTNSTPILDTELNYLRVNFSHTAISPSGCTFGIRVSKPILAMKSVSDASNEDFEKLIDTLIIAGSNVTISGKTGSGKTELQKLLTSFIPDNKKIILIEDTMDSHIKELYPSKDIMSWRTLNDDTRENKIEYKDLIKAALRNNPDWIFVTETRDSEAYAVVESALTDHNIITTIHTNKASAIISRYLSMIRQKYPINELLFGKDIVNVLPIGIYMDMEETENGIKRYIREVVEFTDFTENGVEYISIYRKSRTFDKTTGNYKDEVITNPLSEELLEKLTYKRLYHLIPESFKR
ncbi:CpaF/VirB11 family protein [Ornithinibacillus contaminans]|uniref:CpaF/VirB11 family protein n=1 Tax=Ornithinibacillus contaminans TaxID=694055 RepID=UPI00064DEF16|nr:CpaF/VirB11 family protein [Ornithinibacillus contaminans]